MSRFLKQSPDWSQARPPSLHGEKPRERRQTARRRRPASYDVVMPLVLYQLDRLERELRELQA